MSEESDRQTLGFAKDFIVWMMGLVFISDVVCIAKFMSASKAEAVPEYLLPAVIALSITLIYTICIFLRLVSLSSLIPLPNKESNIFLVNRTIPSLKSLLLGLVGLVVISFSLVLLWVL